MRRRGREVVLLKHNAGVTQAGNLKTFVANRPRASDRRV